MKTKSPVSAAHLILSTSSPPHLTEHLSCGGWSNPERRLCSENSL